MKQRRRTPPPVPKLYHLPDVYDIRLNQADLLFCRGSGALSRAILASTRSRGEGQSEASHVAVVVDPGNLFDAEIVEAAGVRVRKTTVGEAYADGLVGLTVARPCFLSDEGREKVAAKARRLQGRPYGFGKLPLHALDTFLGWVARRPAPIVFRKLGVWSGRPICSVLAADAFHSVGHSFGGVPWQYAQPDDILDACKEQGPLWSWPLGDQVAPLPTLGLPE